MPPVLLLTRPIAQSRQFARQAQDLPAHEVLISPLSEVVARPFDPAILSGARGLILTSANALPFLPPLPGLPAWCVGPATTRAAAAAGFVARDCGGDAAAMVALLRAEQPEGPLVHPHGTDLARDLAAECPGLVRSVAVYTARALPLGDAARTALATRNVFAPLFSPRAARLFRAQIEAPRDLVCVAISPACAAQLPPDWKVQVADRPDAGGMLRALAVAMSQRAPTG